MKMIALLHVLKLITKKNLINIIVEIDSQVLIHMLKENTQIFSYILLNCRSLIKDLNEFNQPHLPRRNVVANKLAAFERRHMKVLDRQ